MAGLVSGPHSSPEGLRHHFSVHQPLGRRVSGFLWLGPFWVPKSSASILGPGGVCVTIAGAQEWLLTFCLKTHGDRSERQDCHHVCWLRVGHAHVCHCVSVQIGERTSLPGRFADEVLIVCHDGLGVHSQCAQVRMTKSGNATYDMITKRPCSLSDPKSALSPPFDLFGICAQKER